MTVPPTGNEREGGFLQSNERAFLAEQGCYPLPYSESNSGGVKARSRLKNEVTNVEGMRQVLLGMTTDLDALLLFMLRDEGTDWQDWSNFTLPQVQDEMEQLRDTLDRFIEIAEDDSLQDEYDEIQDATANLYEDVDRATEGFNSGVLDIHEGGETDETQLIWEAFEEREARQEGLLTLVRNDGAADVLEYIADKGPRDLPTEKRGTEYMASIATNKLEPDGLVSMETEDLLAGKDKEYEITERGDAVLDTWRALLETTAVEMEREANPEASDRELVESALQFHFDLEDGPVYPF